MFYYEIDGKPGFGLEKFDEMKEITEHQCRAMLDMSKENILFFIKKNGCFQKNEFCAGGNVDDF